MSRNHIVMTVSPFLEVFADYNVAVWPMQIVPNGIAVAVIYHAAFIAAVNPAAMGFGAMFIVQVLLFVWAALKGRGTYRATWGWKQSI